MGAVQPNTVIFGYHHEDKHGTMLARFIKSKAAKKFPKSNSSSQQCTAREYLSMLKSALDLELNIIIAKG